MSETSPPGSSSTLGEPNSSPPRGRRVALTEPLVELPDFEEENGEPSAIWGVFRALTSIKQAFTTLVIIGGYLGVSILVYSQCEGWDWANCVYFAVITLTTVGYGDLVPKHWGSKLFLCVFLITALIIVAGKIGEVMEGAVAREIAKDKEKKRLGLKQRHGIFDQVAHTKQHKSRFFRSLFFLFAFIAAFTVLAFFSLNDVVSWPDALYFSVVTLTTVGYGDIAPKQEESRLLIATICFFGVPIFGLLLTTLAEGAYGKAQSSELKTIVGGLTAEKLGSIMDFCEEMQKKGAYKDEDGLDEIDRLEFLCFILVKNDMIEIDDIGTIMQNFNELDADGNGHLDPTDIAAWEARGVQDHQEMRMHASRRNLYRVNSKKINSQRALGSPLSNNSAGSSPKDESGKVAFPDRSDSNSSSIIESASPMAQSDRATIVALEKAVQIAMANLESAQEKVQIATENLKLAQGS